MLWRERDKRSKYDKILIIVEASGEYRGFTVALSLLCVGLYIFKIKNSTLIKQFFNVFYWNVVYLQCYVNFCCMAKWFM